MGENLMCRGQKANSRKYKEGWDRIFNPVGSEPTNDILYPEEVRMNHIERTLNNARKDS